MRRTSSPTMKERTMTTLQAGAGYHLAPSEGPATWFLDTLMTVKAGGEQTTNAFTLLEWMAPPGFGPPRHIHHTEDEAFYVLEGAMCVTCGDDSWEATAGSFVFLPRGIPHSFLVTSEMPIRGLQITAPPASSASSQGSAGQRPR